jgi:divalent metal cation (Fe/Co/Zn/Cd) transporter
MQAVVLAQPLGAAEHARLVRRARALALGANAWHLLEFGVALGAGIAASSIALIAFGADSLIELFAGSVVYWRFGRLRSGSAPAELRAQRLIAASFFVLAAYVTAESVRTLVTARHPGASWVGVGLAAFTAVTMPFLAVAKQRVGVRLGSRATASEGASVALLAGLLLNAVAGWWWADQGAALVVAAVALREGAHGWRGETCCDAC